MSKPKTPKDGATHKLDLSVAGKRIRPTTGISDPKVARKVASAAKELAEHVETASPERLKRLCAAIFDAAGVTPPWENQAPEPTPPEFVTTWLYDHRASLSDDLYAKYCGALQNFVGTCPAKTVRLIRRSHVLSWHRELEKQFSPATASQKVGLLAKALQDAVDEGLMDSNPARRIGSVTATVERKDLSDTQINQVRHWLTHSKEAHKQEWIVAIDLARWNGLRLMDAVSIRPENVDVGNYILDFVCQRPDSGWSFRCTLLLIRLSRCMGTATACASSRSRSLASASRASWSGLVFPIQSWFRLRGGSCGVWGFILSATALFRG